jgi:tRNA A37 threonylcarbamoyladenosine dehydratase
MVKLHCFSRTEILIGPEGLKTLAGVSVAVFGLGGVGSYAAEALGRAGVGRLTLVDFDKVCISNINRQLHAMSSTVGQGKVKLMAERLRLINPDAEIIEVPEFYTADNSERLLEPGFDYVVDAIDHFTGKVHLIRSCRERGIPVIASMGAAMKLDPTLIRVADIADTSKCRMARSVRKLLRQAGIERGVTVVYSQEEFRGLREVTPTKAELPDGGEWRRRATLGSISFIPSIFGLTMAGVVVNDLLKKSA